MTARLTKLTIPLIAAALVVSSCGQEAAQQVPAPTVTETVAAELGLETAPPIMATPPDPVVVPAALEIECYSDDYSEKEIVGSLSEAWASNYNCNESEFVGDTITKVLDEWRLASGITDMQIEDLELYISVCAGRDYPWSFEDLSESQIEEVSQVMKVCPDHPDAARMPGVIEVSGKRIAQDQNGDRVYNGTYYVPEDAKAGKWQSEGKVKDCYWEVTSGSGEIVSNNFARAGREVEFTVKDGQSFTIEGSCGAFARQ